MKTASRLNVPTLLVTSLSCLMLTACGIDDKPGLPWEHDKTQEVNPSNNEPEILLLDYSSSPSEKDGELHYVVKVKDADTLKDKTVTVKYQIAESASEGNVAELLKDQSKQSGTITLTTAQPQIDLKID